MVVDSIGVLFLRGGGDGDSSAGLLSTAGSIAF